MNDTFIELVIIPLQLAAFLFTLLQVFWLGRLFASARRLNITELSLSEEDLANHSVDQILGSHNKFTTFEADSPEAKIIPIIAYPKNTIFNNTIAENHIIPAAIKSIPFCTFGVFKKC